MIDRKITAFFRKQNVEKDMILAFVLTGIMMYIVCMNCGDPAPYVLLSSSVMTAIAWALNGECFGPSNNR